jgi:hypothetical protein
VASHFAFFWSATLLVPESRFRIERHAYPTLREPCSFRTCGRVGRGMKRRGIEAAHARGLLLHIS